MMDSVALYNVAHSGFYCCENNFMTITKILLSTGWCFVKKEPSPFYPEA